MISRHKFVFYGIIGLTLIWFTVILLCKVDNQLDLPQAEPFHELENEHLSLNQILYYQLDTSFSGDDVRPISAKDHTDQTAQLASIENDRDNQVDREGHHLTGFNLLVSNRIGTFRRLPDTRHQLCRNNHNSSSSHDKPDDSIKASIIICYYNEAPSALLRTINSILKRSPLSLIQEILIIDDYSQPGYDHETIRPYIKSKLVSIHSTERREGLIRARLFGAGLARGNALIFLDSHVEANEGWLEPLLSTIRANRTTIACPIIDIISAKTMQYTPSPMVFGGLIWNLNFKWDSVHSSKLMTQEDFVRPIESATMAGGLYAIDRSYFYEIGSYDQGMDLWGGENVEMSLRVWMCGGRIVILPCSRLGHIFRKTRPYGPDPDKPDSLIYNSHRTAQVWLDEYIDQYYIAQPTARTMDSGDVSQRRALRHDKLKCQNFTWYIHNVYPKLLDLMVNTTEDKEASTKTRSLRSAPITIKPTPSTQNLVISSSTTSKSYEGIYDKLMLARMRRLNRIKPPKILGLFQIQSKGSNLCVESRGMGFNQLFLGPCAKIDLKYLDRSAMNALNQIWTETDLHELRMSDNQCLDIVRNLPVLRNCHYMGTFQTWTHSDRMSNTSTTASELRNPHSGLCLGVERAQINEPLIVTICDKTNANIAMHTGSFISAESHRKDKHADSYKRHFGLKAPNWFTRDSFIPAHDMNLQASISMQLIREWKLLNLNDLQSK